MMIRGYIATSVDGYVADKDGGIDWLRAFDDVDYGYDAFISEIDTVVMGRRTYNQIPSLGIGWPYLDKRGFVATSSPLTQRYPGVEAWAAGVDKLIARLRQGGRGDVWVVGGPQLQWAFIEAGALERLDLFLIPVLLGDGIPLFPRTTSGLKTLILDSVEMLPKGMVRLVYRL
jgi:dihydrofolate reductase